MRNPGWFAPEEARKAIEAGFANRMMCDWWEPDARYGNEENIYVLAAASVGCEGDMAPTFTFWDILFGRGLSKGKCCMLNKDRLCEIHDSGFKPLQCRTALACGAQEPWAGYNSNLETIKLWDTGEGRAVVELWRAECGVELKTSQDWDEDDDT
jgi:hypothetical protein